MATRDETTAKRYLTLRRAVLAITVGCCLLVGLAAWSIAGALRAPGTDSVQARLAEWGRDHGFSRLVTWLEEEQYKAHPPKVGGGLDPTQRALLGGGSSALRPAITPFAAPPQAGEGYWHAAVVIGGRPAIQEAFVRPDAQHTSYLAAAAWLDHSAVRFELHPGFGQPGPGPWGRPDLIPASARQGLAATFNGGFKIPDSHGGYYQNGHTAGTLRTGAASEVFYTDGRMTVGMWGRDVTMTQGVAAVRQNLNLLVDQGSVAPAVDRGIEQDWGSSMHGAYFVWRSGVGVTARGDVVYVCGPALSVRSLAEILQRAGAVRAMQLDINPAWVSFMTYDASADPADPTPVKLLPFAPAANRYYVDSSRDFVAAYAR